MNYSDLCELRKRVQRAAYWDISRINRTFGDVPGKTLCPTADNLRDAFHVAGKTPLPVPDLAQLEKDCADNRVFVVLGTEVDYAKRLEHDYVCSEGQMDMWYGLRLRYVMSSGRID